MSASLADRAREIVGAEHLLVEPEAIAAHAVDGVLPTAVARPGTPEETGALLAAAGDAGAGVLPWGAGAHQHLGQVPSRADLVVDTTRLVGITDYTPADYVVAVRAGTRFRDLQAELAKHNQWLPIDPPGAGRATVGGLIAANRNGPRRLLWGSIRDMLIGIRVALPTGEVIKAGGKVVKNVAGYDLGKLFIGSLGAAGIVTEATFKISPVPGDGLTVLVTVPDLGAAHALTTAVMRSYLLPSALEAVNPPAFRRLAGAVGAPVPPADAWGVLLLAEGLEESRARHVSEMRAIGGAAGRMEVLEGDAHRALWDAVAEFPSPGTHPGGVVCRAGGPIARWGDLAQTLQAIGNGGRPVEIVAHAGVGLLYAAAAADAGPALVEALGPAADTAGGYAVVEAAPPALKARLPIWGTEPGGLALMRRLRAAYDPRGIMVPGRLGWGLS
ncbi:MAG TPA: FAD-binding oxidoreductase [bacterium]|nr:FAD-binding oxidoreductase [bacterium]